MHSTVIEERNAKFIIRRDTSFALNIRLFAYLSGTQPLASCAQLTFVTLKASPLNTSSSFTLSQCQQFARTQHFPAYF